MNHSDGHVLSKHLDHIARLRARVAVASSMWPEDSRPGAVAEVISATSEDVAWHRSVIESFIKRSSE